MRRFAFSDWDLNRVLPGRWEFGFSESFYLSVQVRVKMLYEEVEGRRTSAGATGRFDWLHCWRLASSGTWAGARTSCAC